MVGDTVMSSSVVLAGLVMQSPADFRASRMHLVYAALPKLPRIWMPSLFLEDGDPNISFSVCWKRELRHCALFTVY